VALQVAPGFAGGRLLPYRHLLLVASGALLAGWFAANLRSASGLLRWALGAALLGAAMNLAVMVPNGGMPVSRAAMAVIGGSEGDVNHGNLYKHRLAGKGTVLAPLGDVIPVPPLNMAASPGDLILLVGILGTVLTLAVPRRRLA